MKITTLEVAGIVPALLGMRNPMNSWDRSDSFKTKDVFLLGEEDLKLANTLVKAGAEHSKFLRQIQVWANFDMPRYWWSEFDTYHFNTKNSCSTMHKLLNTPNPITEELFVTSPEDADILKVIIQRLEELRLQFLETRNAELLVRAKRLLPEGFLQLRTVNTNYAEIMNIYNQRKNHRLKEEWVDTFCEWCNTLPYFRELCIYPFEENVYYDEG